MKKIILFLIVTATILSGQSYRVDFTTAKQIANIFLSQQKKSSKDLKFSAVEFESNAKLLENKSNQNLNNSPKSGGGGNSSTKINNKNGNSR